MAGQPRTTTYTYTGAGSFWSATDTGGTITVNADRLGRPLNVAVSGDTAATTTYGYSCTAPIRTDASGANTMTLDTAGRTVRIDDPLHAADWQFAYGARGELVTTTWPTTTALSTTSSSDGMGRLVRRTTAPGQRADATLAYNRAGNRLTEASTVTGDPSNGPATTGYDPLGRLTAYGLPSLARSLGATWQAIDRRGRCGPVVPH